jgi:hypothetical protein
MIKILVLIVGLVLPNILLGKDSPWLLCDDGGLALSMYERNSRTTALTLLFGEHLLTGTKSKDVTLRGKTGSFKGHVEMVNQGKRVAVNGSLIIAKVSHPINAVLECRIMDY